MDVYISRQPLTEDQLRDSLLFGNMLNLVNEEEILLAQRLQAARQGTPVDPGAGPWHKEREELPLTEQETRAFEQGMNHKKERLQYILDHWDEILKL